MKPRMPVTVIECRKCNARLSRPADRAFRAFAFEHHKCDRLYVTVRVHESAERDARGRPLSSHEVTARIDRRIKVFARSILIEPFEEYERIMGEVHPAHGGSR